MKDNVVLSKAH